MELIRISDGKIKVMLTACDVNRLQLHPEEENGAFLCTAFRTLLSEIEEESGFESNGKELAIQYFPSREGGCEMFISHLSGENGASAETARPLPKEITEFHREYAFRFQNMDAMLLACKRLAGAGYIGDSLAFKGEGTACFLFLSLLSCHPFEMPEELLFLSEYGNQECVNETKIYLSEHGALLCQNPAVATLANFA